MYHLVIYPWKLYLRVPYCPWGRRCFSQICHIICVVNARSSLPYYKSDENISRIIDDIKCEIHALKIGQPGPFLSAYLARNLRIFYEFFKLIKFHTTIQSSHLQLCSRSLCLKCTFTVNCFPCKFFSLAHPTFRKIQLQTDFTFIPLPHPLPTKEMENEYL